MKWVVFSTDFGGARTADVRAKRRWIVLGLVLLLVQGVSAQDSDQESSGDAGQPTPADSPGEASVSSAKIADWIEQLDDDRYEVRERASRKLSEHGQAALEPLAAAADGNRPEAAARAIVILEELAEAAEVAEAKLAVLERLAGLQQRPSVSRRAEEKLANVWEEISLPIALEMGGRIDPDTEYIDPVTGQRRFQKFIIGPEWTGGDEGLIHVARLGNVPVVSIRRAAISSKGLEQFADMRALRRLELYGTSIDRAEEQRLQNMLPQVVAFDIRRGAMLGVRGQQTALAEVYSVEPGSAAAAAGLQSGDIITKVDDVEVQSFDELTAEIAKHDPGDSAVLQIVRGDTVIQRTVEFGKWE